MRAPTPDHSVDEIAASTERRNPRRHASACDRCRTLKVKCNCSSNCSNCSTAGVECTRDMKSRLRGPSKRYLEALETKLTYLESFVDTPNARQTPSETSTSRRTSLVGSAVGKRPQTQNPHNTPKPVAVPAKGIFACLIAWLMAAFSLSGTQAIQRPGALEGFISSTLPKSNGTSVSRTENGRRKGGLSTISKASSTPSENHYHVECHRANPVDTSHYNPPISLQTLCVRAHDLDGNPESPTPLSPDAIIDATPHAQFIYDADIVSHSPRTETIKAYAPSSSHPVERDSPAGQRPLSSDPSPSISLYATLDGLESLPITGDAWADSLPLQGGFFSCPPRELSLTGNTHLYRSSKIYDGPYSAVYRGIYKDEYGEEDVAIKVIKPVGPKHSIRRRRRREVITGIKVRHPNILPVYGAVEGRMFGPFGAIVTPWCSNGNAVQYLQNYKLSPLERYRLWRGVVDGLVHLHSHEPQIVHGDMKPPNVLIADDGRPMICDLGLARLIVDGSQPSSSPLECRGYEHWAWMGGINTTSAHTGTPRYLAPEQVDLNRPSQPTTATDVYAVACIGFEFIYLVVPYAHREHNLQGQIFHDIRTGVPPASRPDMSSSLADDAPASSSADGIDILWSILESCWSREPRSRPTALLLRKWLVEYEDVIVDALECGVY